MTTQECVYLIRDNKTGLHKIGITGNWSRRSRELQVGRGSTAVKLVPCKEAKKWERVLHAQFRHKRLPQSEWFRITEEEALPKMQWLAQQLAAARERSRLVVGAWKQAQAGHYYRRRKSANGYWYTETKTEKQVRKEREQSLMQSAAQAERVAQRRARSEPGYWPVSGTTDVTWQEKDPSLVGERRAGLIMLGGIFAVLFGLASPGAGLCVALVTALAALAMR